MVTHSNAQSRELVFCADRELEFLSDVSEALREATSEQEIYDILGRALELVVGDQAIINISNYDSTHGLFTPKIIVGLSPILELVVNLLGRKPEEIRGDYPAAAKLAMKTGRLVRLDGGVVALAGEALSPLLCSTAAAMMGIHDVWVLGYARGDLVGGISIIARTPDLKLRTTLIEAVTRQAAGAIERKRIEEALRVNEDLYRSLVSMISDVIWQFEIDRHGRWLDRVISPALERLLQLPPGTIENDVEKCIARIHPDDVLQVRHVLLQAAADPGRDFSCEFRFLREDRSVVRVRAHGMAHAKPEGGVVVYGLTSELPAKGVNREA